MTNMKLAHDLLARLYIQGVREVILCAGARNAPFVQLLSVPNSFQVYRFFEERSAAFFALGRSMSLRQPVAVITTSGTAAANLLPATVEADYQGIPLVLVTADRPRPFRGSGSPQTIDQVGIFSHYVNHCWDLEGEIPANLAIATSRPTHINVCMDEPLIDGPSEWNLPVAREISQSEAIKQCPKPPSQLASLRRPLMLVSALPQAYRQSVVDWLVGAGRPVFTEATSGLRGHERLGELEIQGGPASLRQLDFDGVIRIGGVPTVRLWRDLERSDTSVLHFSHLPFSGMARIREVSPIEALMNSSPRFELFDSTERQMDLELSAKLSTLIGELPLSEVAWFRWLSEQLPQNGKVFVGNSLPIREWDLATVRRPACEVVANRGVNGIDGLISTFAGVSEPEKSNWCVLGDLSTMYDLSGPWAFRERPLMDLNIVVINNGGGKIFTEIFNNPAFENGHDLNFKSWAAMWGMPYQCFTAPQSLDVSSQPRVIEIQPDDEQSKLFWRRWEDVK